MDITVTSLSCIILSAITLSLKVGHYVTPLISTISSLSFMLLYFSEEEP